MPLRSSWTAVVVAGLLVLAALIRPAGAADTFDHAGLAQRAVERHIVPGYRGFAEAADRQKAALAALCGAPGKDALKAARAAFREALVAWGRIEHIRFGPISENDRYVSLLFWPDPRGISRRQIAGVLAQKDASVLDARALATKSVATQGFTALDVLLFGPGSDALAGTGPAEGFRCGYAAASAENVARVARETLDGWTSGSGFSRIWLSAGPGNPAFLTPQETTQALAQSYLTGLMQVRNVRIGGPMGFKNRDTRPLEPIVPHSNLATELIVANIAGLRALLVEADVGAAAPDATAARALVASIVFELTTAEKVLRTAQEQSPRPLQDSAARSQVIRSGFPLKNAYDVTKGYFTKEAGLSMGFNALDGD
jgi:hypothetical protein